MRVHASFTGHAVLPDVSAATAPSTPLADAGPSTQTLYHHSAPVSSIASLTALSVTIFSELNRMPTSCRATLASVVQTLSLILRDSLASTCCAWLITFCFTLGSLFSDHPQAFMITVLMWTKLFNWICVSACYAVNLQPYQCTSSAKARTGLLFWWFKIAMEAVRFVVASTIVLLAVAIGCSKAPPKDACWGGKLVFLFSTVLAHFDTTACSVATTRLFHEETLHGRGRSQISRTRLPYFKRFFRDLRGSILNLMSFIIAAVYAHTTLFLHIAGTVNMAAFMIASMGLKIAMQEAAKHIIFKQKVRSITMMAAFIGIPTILIHTHMSIVMLHAQSLSSTIAGTLSTAVLEIFMRVGKALLVKRQIRHEALRRMAIIKAKKGEDADTGRESPVAQPSDYETIQQKLAHDLEFLAWKTQLLHYYAAEIYVDMFAEYVAIGCSYAILVLFWNHPMFMLGYGSQYDGATLALSQSLFKNSKVLSLIMQVGVEIVVDYVACVAETTQGINMQPLHAHNIYLTFFLTWAAIGNITIAAHVYFRPPTNKLGLEGNGS